MKPTISTQTGLPTIAVSGEMVTFTNFWDSGLFWDEANVFWDAGTQDGGPTIRVTSGVPTLTIS